MYQLFEDHGPLGDPLLLFGEETGIPSSNSNSDEDICRIFGDECGDVGPLPSPLPSLEMIHIYLKGIYIYILIER